MLDYLLVLLSVALLAGAFMVQKFYQKNTDGSTESSTIFSMVSAICSILFLVLRNVTAEGLNIQFSWYSLINSLLKGACGFLYTIIGFKILKRANVATYMLFLMSGGMVVPAIWGWVFLGEPATILRILGIIVMIIAIFLSNSSAKKLDKKLILMCACVFMLNGFVSVFSKLHQVADAQFNPVDTVSYALIGTLCSFAMSSSLKLGMAIKNKKQVSTKPKFKPWLILVIVLYSVVGTVSNLLQLEGAKNLPASVLYPMITGGTIVLSGIFALIFFKEKPSKIEWVGIALCIVGTCLFL